ncbi:MAG: hypothetical protein VW518_10145 [Burkholderiaceae bacterium]
MTEQQKANIAKFLKEISTDYSEENITKNIALLSTKERSHLIRLIDLKEKQDDSRRIQTS